MADREREEHINNLPDSLGRSPKPIRDTVQLYGEDRASERPLLAAKEMVKFPQERRSSRSDNSRTKVALAKSTNRNRKVVENDEKF